MGREILSLLQNYKDLVELKTLVVGVVAERDQLRAEVKRLENALHDAAKTIDVKIAERDVASEDSDQLRAEVEQLRESEAHAWREFRLLSVRGGENLSSALNTAAGLRRALEKWADWLDKPDVKFREPIEATRIALAASPDDHARRIKAEALREFAKSRDIEVVGNGDWYAGIAAERAATVDDLRDTADRLEGHNATTNT